MLTHPDHFVVYADMLGFRNLVLEYRTADADTLGYRRQSSRSRAASLERGNPLQRRFKFFHEKLDETITGTDWKGDVSVLVFSDSLFLATIHHHTCLSFCQRLLCGCVMNSVPIRIGIGYGAFVANDFAFEASPNLKVITTQFLGTGVVYASDAEKALKGMRIALHPSAATALQPLMTRHDRRLALPVEQASEHASHEWNYLPLARDLREDGWTTPFDRHAYVRQIREMKSHADKDPTVQVHYEATLLAVDRMVNQMHNDWLWARRSESDPFAGQKEIHLGA